MLAALTANVAPFSLLLLLLLLLLFLFLKAEVLCVTGLPHPALIILHEHRHSSNPSYPNS